MLSYISSSVVYYAIVVMWISIFNDVDFVDFEN